MLWINNLLETRLDRLQFFKFNLVILKEKLEKRELIENLKLL